MKKLFISFVAVICGIVMLGMNVTPVAAQTAGLGPWGDIEGPYTWQINGKGWTIYSQNGYSWVYDDYGNRTYLDAYGNRLDGASAAAAKTITQYSLTYYTTVSGINVYKSPDGKLYTVGNDGILHMYGTEPAPAPAPTPAPAPSVNNYTFYYSFTSPNGYNVYTDAYGRNWWFAAGGMPQSWTYGYPEGSYWKSGVNNYTYYYSHRSNDGYYIYRDDYNNYWWFGNDGTPHLVKQGSGGQGGDKPAPTPAPSSDVDFSRKNMMEADGVQYTVYVGQYWVAPKTVSWTPEGMHLVGWDYAANTGYVRWKPGAYIKNTGSNLYLYPVYSK